MPPAPPPQSPLPAYQALCSHTHLFPGARCRLQGLPHPEAFAADPEPVDVHLRFSDGTAAPADLRTDPATLTVAAHTTAAGTPLDESAWFVKGFTLDRDEVEMTIGARAPSPPPAAAG